MQTNLASRFARNSLLTGFVLAAAIFLVAENAWAQSILRPMGLEPGDQFRLMFVTEGTRDATSAVIGDYNAFVSAEALLPGSLVRDLDAQWFAIAATADVSAVVNTGTDPSPPGDTGVPIYLVDGVTRIANNYDHWWDGSLFGQNWLLNPPNLTQNGTAPLDGINNVWTGTNSFGEPGGAGGPLGAGITATLGASASSNGRHINNAFLEDATSDLSLYALSSVLTTLPDPLLGDCNQDGEVNFEDIPAFITILQAGAFLAEADVNQDDEVTFSDIPAFIAILAE